DRLSPRNDRQERPRPRRRPHYLRRPQSCLRRRKIVRRARPPLRLRHHNLSGVQSMTAAFDTIAPPQPISRLRQLPRRALIAGPPAALAIAPGAWWIALPASSVSTDDAYLKADSTLVAPKVQGLIATVLVRDNQTIKAGQPLLTIDAEDYRQAVA